ncbi:CapA family protein [Sporosalibacterium faouarense]|uniref:CapA family protein n=1 Tax=Sporosalibacterium faouarense TaxID=516123 RepID=UPI00192B1ECE|nr:CapA family protein [Sporosalibacterium faouarense]
MNKILSLLIILILTFIIFHIDFIEVLEFRSPQYAYEIGNLPEFNKPLLKDICFDDIVNLKKNYIYRKPNLSTITISFAGDCTLGQDIRQGNWNTFPEVAVEKGYEFFFKEVQTVFANDDLTIVNLENPFTNAKEYETRKKYRYKGDPDLVNILKIGSIEAVHIANNHMHDYLEKGFKDTIETLDNAGIIYYGNDTISPVWSTSGGHLGYDFPRVLNIKGVKVGLLGYKGWYDDQASKDKIKTDIQSMKEKSDIVIVTYHWGGQRVYYPEEMQLDLGRFSVDCGADLVVGHHPHVIQGIEKYKDKYIIYSIGNFSFGGNLYPRDRDTIIYQGIFTVRDSELLRFESNIIPCKLSSEDSINNFQPIILDETEKERVMNRIYKYSSPLKYGIEPSS